MFMIAKNIHHEEKDNDYWYVREAPLSQVEIIPPKPVLSLSKGVVRGGVYGTFVASAVNACS